VLALCVIYASSSSAQQPEGARGEASGAAAPSSRLAALNWRRASFDRADRGAASSASDAVATVAAGDAATARMAALAAAWTPSDPNSTWWTEHHSTHSVSSSSSSSGASSSDDASSAADDAAADGAASASSSSASRTSDASAPHIVFVLVDDLGANDISYASTDLPNITTAIDALAADGVTLGACYRRASRRFFASSDRRFRVRARRLLGGSMVWCGGGAAPDRDMAVPLFSVLFLFCWVFLSRQARTTRSICARPRAPRC